MLDDELLLDDPPLDDEELDEVELEEEVGLLDELELDDELDDELDAELDDDELDEPGDDDELDEPLELLEDDELCEGLDELLDDDWPGVDDELELDAIGEPLPVGSVMPAHPATNAAGAPISSNSRPRRSWNSRETPSASLGSGPSPWGGSL